MSTLPGYYSRFDPAKNFEEHLFRAGYVLQSAEVNEIQQHAAYRHKQLGDALFKDGDIIRDARIIVDQATGAVQCESGAIYIKGAVRGVPVGSFTIATTGTVVIGIYLTETNVTELEDPTLLDPAAELRNYQEPGAGRRKLEPSWGVQGGEGEFFPIYYVDDGIQRAKEPPPQLDSVTQAIARYDRDSAGSNYVVSGLKVSQLADDAGNQVYNVEEGRARVNGFPIQRNTATRLLYAAAADQRYISNEPKTSTNATSFRVNVDRPPIASIQQVSVTKETTDSIVHGGVTGSQDPIPNTSVISIIEVKQGATTYTAGTDYQLTAGKVDWSLTGAEPAPGSTYTVKYRHIANVTPTAVDDTGFTVAGAVVGTLVLTNYYTKLPRIDRLCIDEEGKFVWVKGVSTDYDPVRPSVPSNLIALAQVVQTWTSSRRVINDGVRVVPMSQIEGIFSRLDLMTDLIAQQKLTADLVQREAAAKKGLFVDPFIDDLQRDAGAAQDAAVVQGILTLPIAGSVLNPSIPLTSPQVCAYTLEPVLQQTARTGSMKINPYMAFDPIPAAVSLNPAIDRWTEVQTTWTSGITQRFLTGVGNRVVDISTSVATQLVKTESESIQNLRQIQVSFRLTGFGPNEMLNSVLFDGISVTPVP